MSFIRPIAPEELGTKYTHYGLFCGLVPVYVGRPESESPDVVERNWVPALWLWIVVGVYGLFIAACSLVNDDYEPAWPITITGPIQ